MKSTLIYFFVYTVFICLVCGGFSYLLYVQDRDSELEQVSSLEFFGVDIKTSSIAEDLLRKIKMAQFLKEQMDFSDLSKKQFLPLLAKTQDIVALGIHKKSSDKGIFGEEELLSKDVFSRMGGAEIFLAIRSTGSKSDLVSVLFKMQKRNAFEVVFRTDEINNILQKIFVGNLGSTFLAEIATGKVYGENLKSKKEELFLEVKGRIDSGEIDLGQFYISSGMLTYQTISLDFPEEFAAEIQFSPFVIFSFIEKEPLYKNIIAFKNQVMAYMIAAIVFLSFVFFVYAFLRNRQREIEANLRAEREKNLEKSRLATIGETAAGIGHEINNPMTIIQMNAEVIGDLAERDPVGGQEMIKENIESMQRTITRVARIIRGLKTIGRDASEDPLAPHSIKDIVDDALSICRVRARDAAIELLIDEIDPSLDVDCRPSQISQVVLNMVNNSIHATKDLEEKWIKIECAKGEQFIELRITDSGSGIPLEIQDKIFNPFFTTKDVGVGTGIGLNLSRKIIMDHQGELSIDNESPNTSFLIRLPVVQA